MRLLDRFRARRPAVIPPEPDGPWAILDGSFFEGPGTPVVTLIGVPYFAGTRAGGDGQPYSDVCVGASPDAIASIQTKSRKYCFEMARAWMEAGDALDPAPPALADDRAVPFLTVRGQA